MKVAVFGNSHVGMIRAASEDPAYAAHEFAWMARHTPGTRNFRVEGTRLVDDTEGKLFAPIMQRALDLAKFDLAIVAGNTIRVNDLIRLFRGHFVPGWVSSRKANALWKHRKGWRSKPEYRQPMTEAALQATIAGHIRDNLSCGWVTALRGAVSIPICVVPPAFAREAVLLPETQHHQAFRNIADWDVFDRIGAVFNAAHLDAFAGLDGVTVIPQDPRAVTRGFFTAEGYARGAPSLIPGKPYKTDDMLHGNDALGRLILDSALGLDRREAGQGTSEPAGGQP